MTSCNGRAPACRRPPIGPVDKYYDVSGDGVISRLDLDILVQHLNQRGSFVRSRSLSLESAEGEGGQDPITLTLIEPDDAYEGIALSYSARFRRRATTPSTAM